MCGIAGYFQLNESVPPQKELIGRMLQIIRHRGPDELGAYFDTRCGLGQARLSIIDLAGGSQPLCNEDGSIWITFNGEIFNYIELRQDLVKAGHKFRTQSDTEVIVHAFEEWGDDCLERFNGQFAFAIYDRNRRRLFAARDRMGIRPFFYTVHQGTFSFASEIKAIFCNPEIPRQIDLEGLDQIFTWWTTAASRTAFRGISELEAGTWLEIVDGRVTTGRYWSVDFPETFDDRHNPRRWSEELHELLVDSVRLRLRSDVPVGAYLSGGLDSSATTALIKNFTDSRLETFSIAFHDKAYDESGFQKEMADHLGTNHNQIKCSLHDIAENFPRVIWHTERPIVRTAPTPLMMLSGLVRQHDFKVVLTGEGADEILGGYDIFKETLIRTFWARNPESTWRPSLLRRLYPTLPVSGARARLYLETFYKAGLSQSDKYYFSHIPRINTTSKVKDLFSADVKDQLKSSDALAAFAGDLPEGHARWHPLARAQYLEMRSLLAGYLLSSQGDRVAAANSVETRFPFLDHRLVEFAAKIPPHFKLSGLNEKYVLKKAMAAELPQSILNRVKQPYMAPDSNSFVQEDSPEYIDEILSEDSLNRNGIFNPTYVQRLRAKCTRLSHAHMSFKDNMSFIGVLSTQLLAHSFIDNFPMPSCPSRDEFSVWVETDAGVSTGSRA